jgi:3-oxoacyl-[acyl-carrier protein] reductase
MFSLSGSRVLITGGGGAIGRAIALKMASQGADVAICDVRNDLLDATVCLVMDSIGKGIAALQCDLSDTSKAGDVVRRAEDLIGPIDVLINNAGINKDVLFSKMTEDDLDAILNLNLRAVFTLTRAAVLAMAPRRFGRIINISSVVGVTGNIGQANYCASKAGVIGMSKAVALEYAGRGITVNCVAPGAIASPMLDKLSEQAREKFTAKIPMRRIGEPNDVAFACCFLASREASYITGQTIHVNGGMLMA